MHPVSCLGAVPLISHLENYLILHIKHDGNMGAYSMLYSDEYQQETRRITLTILNEVRHICSCNYFIQNILRKRHQSVGSTLRVIPRNADGNGLFGLAVTKMNMISEDKS